MVARLVARGCRDVCACGEVVAVDRLYRGRIVEQESRGPERVGEVVAAAREFRAEGAVEED